MDITPDKYVLDPLDANALEKIEDEIGCDIPEPLRSFLGAVGFLNSLVGGDWPQSAREFVKMQDYIPENLVGIMGDGAGNHFAMTPEGEMVFCDHEMEEIEMMEEDFEEFLAEIVAEPEPIETLAWHTQLSFSTSDGDLVFQLLRKHLGVEITGDWVSEGVSPAGVSSFTIAAETSDGPAEVGRLSYADWKTDLYSINRAIAIADVAKYRAIFAALEREPGAGFRLVNYGLLPVDLG